MSETLFPAGPVDLEALDQFLMSDASPEDCMQLSDLDGFLTGIAIGPELVMPSEWLPAIWGGDEPVFESIEQTQTVIGTIMGRYNEIRRALSTDLEAYAPLFWEGPSGEVIAADWAEGFVDAIRPVCGTHLAARTFPEQRCIGFRVSTECAEDLVVAAHDGADHGLGLFNALEHQLVAAPDCW